MELSSEMVTTLIKSAINVRENAYAPYSRFKVGASLLAESGKIYSGCNFENVSFGAGTCAERVALGNAIAAGETKFVAIAVCGGDSALKPCGICRQALLEFGNIRVICVDANGEQKEEYTLNDLMPGAFSEFKPD